jgi:hypothetical protein
MHMCSYMLHSFRRCYTRFGAYPNYTYIKIFARTTYYKAAAQIGTNVMARVFNAGLLARSQFASGRSCGRPTRSWLSVGFLGP